MRAPGGDRRTETPAEVVSGPDQVPRPEPRHRLLRLPGALWAGSDTAYIEYMPLKDTQQPTPPGGLRPAQMGVVLLGRVILGHAAVTLVDLAQRGFLRADEMGQGAPSDWQIEIATRSLPDGSSGLLSFEEALLGHLVRGTDRSLLSELTGQLAPALQRFKKDLIRDAAHHGRLRRLHRHERTPEGEQLAQGIRSFRAALRHLKASGGEDALDSYLPYALMFGLESRDRLPYERFVRSWVQACAGLPGWQPNKHGRPRSCDPDFTREEWRGMGLSGADAMALHL